MLEGLEVSEVNYSYVVENNILRLDSNYFSKEFLNDELLISSTKYSKLKSLTSSILSFGAYSLNNEVEYLDKGVPFVRGVNLKNGRIDLNDVIYISNDTHKLLWKSEVVPSTVLLSMSGTIGDVAIASKNLNYPLNSNQDIAKIVPKEISSEYLYLFLISKFGQNFLKREARGSVQQHVYLSQIEEFNIPMFSPNFVGNIESLVYSSDEKYERFQKYYTQAENLLLETLGLQNFQPSTGAVNVKPLKESFLNSGRLDAEYYQPKYEDLFNQLKSLKHKLLGSVVSIKKSIEPGSSAYQESGIPFVRVSNLNKFGIAKPEIHLDEKEYGKVIKPKKNTVLLSKDGSVGIAYKVEDDLNCITSGAILHLTVKDKDLLPDYLTLVLNSFVVKMQAERDAGGSIIQHWKPSEIQEVIIPIAEKHIQKQITQLLQESFVLKAESEKLLAIAKRAVEVAIEQNEEVALTFIKENS